MLSICSRYVLEQILSGEATEIVVERIHEYLIKIGDDIRGGKIKLDEFIIFKVCSSNFSLEESNKSPKQQLGKNPEHYPDAKSQPHVQVALRMKAKGGSGRAGDVIPYIFCLGEDDDMTQMGQAERARHPDEIRKNDSGLRVGMCALKNMPFVGQLTCCVSFDPRF
jgi:DNA polymerase alpha subunit A